MDKSETTPKPVLKIIREYVEAIGIAIILALFIRTFIVQAFKIPSGSMIPTLLIGDHILVNKFIYGIKIPGTDIRFLKFKQPKRGDVIVFKYPPEPDKDYIKRVVGLPGDTIDVRKNQLYINNEPVSSQTEDTLFINDASVSLTPLDDYIYDQPAEQGDTCSKVTAKHYNEVIDKIEHEVIYVPIYGFGRRRGLPKTVPEGHLFVMGDNRNNSSDSREWGFVPMENIRGKALIIYFSWAKCGNPFSQLTRIGSVIR